MRKYKTKEVAEILHVSNNTIYRIIKSLPEQLKPKKSDDGVYEFTAEDVSTLRKAVELREDGLTYAEVKRELDLYVAVPVYEDQEIEVANKLDESEEIVGMDLTVINQDGKLLVDSREVARMIDKRHDHLMRDIRGYTDILDINPTLGTSNFFIESTFKDSYDREQPCYLLTRKGCDMVANKMTGEKGIIFTAKYVTKFEEMEKQQQAPMGQLSPQLQLLISMELKQTEMEMAITEAKQHVIETRQEVRAMRDAIVINPKTEWREETNRVLNNIGRKLDDYKQPKKEAYEALQDRARCRPNVLVANLQKRALENGMAPSRAEKLNLLDVLENDPRLREVYIGIVKQMASKYL